MLSVAIANNDTKKHEVAYRLDGPNGLPLDGSWYAMKVGGGARLRDVAYQLGNNDIAMASSIELSDKYRKDIGDANAFANQKPQFFGVDALYFSVVAVPDAESAAPNLDRAIALRMGDVEPLRKTLTNTSFRLSSKPLAIAAGKTCAPQRFEIFAGPKQPKLLAQAVLRAEAGPLRADQLRLADLQMGGRAHDGGPALLLRAGPQLRAGNHHADDRRPPVHVPLEPHAGAERADDAETAAGDRRRSRSSSRRSPRKPARPSRSFLPSTTTIRWAAACCC